MTAIKRRAFPRARVQIEVSATLLASGQVFEGTLRDISIGGAYLQIASREFHRSLQIGTSVELRIPKFPPTLGHIIRKGEDLGIALQFFHKEQFIEFMRQLCNLMAGHAEPQQ